MKKRFILALILILNILLFSNIVSAGCAISESGGCQLAESETEKPSADFYYEDCSNFDQCNIVCCFTAQQLVEPVYANQCAPSQYPHNIFPFEDIEGLDPDIDICDMNCEGDVTKVCPDGETIITLRDCLDDGTYIFTSQTCEEDVPEELQDTDGDGVPDDEDECDYDPLLDAPNGLAENIDLDGNDYPEGCHDEFDNDCDGFKNLADSDCAEACAEDETKTYECDDDIIITTDICEDGEWIRTTEMCAEETAFPEGYCGDGDVQTPNEARFDEECDASTDLSKIEAQTEGSSFCLGGRGVCKLPGITSHPMIMEDEDNCKCYYVCDGLVESAFPLTVGEDVSDLENPFNIISWDLGSHYCDILEMKVFYCMGENEDCSGPWAPIDSGTADENVVALTDSSFYTINHVGITVDENTRYCYKVSVEFDEATGGVESQIQCVSTGDPRCFLHLDKWCNENKTAVMDCTTNREVTETPCASNEFCTELDEETAECVTVPPCGQCNQLFYMFGMGAIGRLLCEEEYPYCTIDSSKTNADMFYPCSDTPTCYDFTSETACTENLCNLGCEWLEDEAAYSSYGIGVCRPTDSFDLQCEECMNLIPYSSSSDLYKAKLRDNTKFNRVFGLCSATLCPMYGSECMMTAGTGGNCKNAADLGCRAYGMINTDEGCGDSSVLMDTTYDDTVRIGTTNAILENSTDKYNFSVCYFDSEQGGCFKDADGDNLPDCGDFDDFDSFDWTCEGDVKPPFTSVDTTRTLKQEGLPLLSKYVDLPISLSESGSTYFCFDTTGSCYPDQITVCRIQKIFEEGGLVGDPLGGPAILRYYTEDEHKNLEEVRQIDVILDTTSPTMEVVVSESVYPMLEVNLTSMITNDAVECWAWLETEEGVKVSVSPTSSEEHSIDHQKGYKFTRNYYNLQDNMYFFKYECKDMAGNLVKGKEAIDVDTNRIHSPLPYGPQATDPGQYTLSVVTDEPAVCKYKEVRGGEKPDFDIMTPMYPDSSELNHNVIVDVYDPETYNTYAVQCDFEGVIEGERNDRVRFSIDNTAPRIELSSSMDGAVSFDTSFEYVSPLVVYMHCIDDSVYKATGVRNFDFGCDYTDYSFTGIDYTNTNGWVKEDQGEDPYPMGPLIIEDETAYIDYSTFDLGGTSVEGNTEVLVNNDGPDVTVEVIRVLDTEKLITGTISDTVNSQDPAASDSELGIGDYKVIIRADSIIKSSAIWLSIPDASIGKYLFAYDVSRLTENAYTLKIPRMEGTVDPINGSLTITVLKATPGAQCAVDEFNVEDTARIMAINFSVDLFSPDIKLAPLLNDNLEPGAPNDFAYNLPPYHNIEYKMYKHTETLGAGLTFDAYYTNQPNLFITGLVNYDHVDRTAAIEFYSGSKIFNIGLTGTYFFEDNAELTDDGTELIGSCQLDVANKGSKAIPIFCGVSPPISYFEDKYLMFDHSLSETGYGYTDTTGYNKYGGDNNIDRLDYKHFGDFYEVESVSPGQITLKEPLEADINQDTEWYAFKKPHPANWFGYPLYLEPGMNNVVIKPIGDNLVPGTINGEESKLFKIILDIYPPEVVKSTPRPGSTNKHYSNLTFEIKEIAGADFGALLDIDSLVLKVVDESANTEIYSVAQGCEITIDQSGPIYNYLLVCSRGEEFGIGTYDVLLTGQDKAGNELTDDPGYTNYTFTIDDGIPNDPTWTFEPAYFLESGNKWFTNEIPDFIVDFTDDDIQVVLGRLFKLQLGETGVGSQVGYSCDETEFNYFECDFDFDDDAPDTEKILMNEEYTIVIESYLDFPEEEGPLAKFPSELLVLDNIAPEVTSHYFKSPIAQNKNLSFELTVPNELFELNVTMLYYGDGETYKLDELLNNKFGDYVYYWTVPFYDKAIWGHLELPQQLNITVKDYAGNAAYKLIDDLVIDLTPPDFNTFIFTPLVPFEEPTKVPPKYYTNNCTVDIVGSFTDDDIDDIVIAPISYVTLSTIGNGNMGGRSCIL